MKTGDGQLFHKVNVVLQTAKVRGDENVQIRHALVEQLVCLLEFVTELLSCVHHQNRLIQLNPRSTSCSELFKELNVRLGELRKERVAVEVGVLRILRSLTEPKKRQRTQDDRAGIVASLLGLNEVVHGLVVVQLELRLLGKFRHQVVVV